jgi:hypothetical protein
MKIKSRDSHRCDPGTDCDRRTCLRESLGGLLRRLSIVAFAAAGLACTTDDHFGGGSPAENLSSDNSGFHRTHIPSVRSIDGLEARTFQNFLMVGPIDSQELLYARASGIKTVIDIRSSDTWKNSLADRSEALELELIRVEPPHGGSLSENLLAALIKVVTARQESHFLIVADSTAWAGVWVALITATRSNLNGDAAVDLATGMGVNDAALLTMAKQVVDGGNDAGAAPRGP